MIKKQRGTLTNIGNEKGAMAATLQALQTPSEG